MAELMGPDFITLLVKDLEVSRHFYADVIGFKVKPETRADLFRFDTQPIGFAIRKPQFELTSASSATGILLWFKTDNAPALFQKLQGYNVPMVHELEDGPFGKTFMFRDPDGYPITVHDGG
jgi:catechol 2,3-dioxygenase-like lactoylglutathione lyase family enzyme